MKRPPKNGVRITHKKTLLVDGNALFKTAYHGAKNEYNRKGIHIGGLYQFFTILRKQLDTNTFHSVYVFWDGALSGKLRWDFYKDYKSGRGKDYINGTLPLEEEFQEQWLRTTQYLEELHIRQIYHEIVESDDFIAYYCLNKAENEKVYILSSDRDFCQLINDDITLYLIDKKKFVTPNNYNDFFSHHPDNACLVKMITGDNSDSIKGIKGMGEKTLLNHIPDLKTKKLTLESVLSKAKAIQDERLSTKGKKPLKAIDSLLNGITDGIQGDKFFEINERLVNLKNPLLTEDAIEIITTEMQSPIDTTDRVGVKKVMEWMREDGFDDNLTYGEGIPGYLMPYSKLIKREKQKYKDFINKENNN